MINFYLDLFTCGPLGLAVAIVIPLGIYVFIHQLWLETRP